MAVILHVGSLFELSLGAYLSRVLLHLVAYGALGLLVRWVIELGMDDGSGSVDR